MTTGLPVSRLIRVNVNLAPLGAQFANVNSLLILGDSDVIDTDSRTGPYADLDSIALDFGGAAPEYLAAQVLFSKSPRPAQVFVGRWAQAATAGRLLGAALTVQQQALAAFQAIVAGSLKVSIDGAATAAITALNFAACANLNAVAAIIDAALAGASVSWNGSRFQIKSDSTGAASTIGFPTAPGARVDIAALLGRNLAHGARPVGGIVPATAL